MSSNKELQKTQYVVAFFPDFEEISSALSYAIVIAKMLDKPLMLLHIIEPKQKNQTVSSAISQLKQIQKTIQNTPNPVKINVLQGKADLLIEKSSELLDIVCIISYVNTTCKNSPASPSALLKLFGNARMAYMLVQQPLLNKQLLDNIVFTVDVEKESKEKVIWASYFGRFNASQIHVLHYTFKDEFLAKRLQNNLQFIEKMFENVAVDYQMKMLLKGAKSIDLKALDYVNAAQGGLLITIPAKNNWLQSVFIQNPTIQIIDNEKKWPILFINPRKDIYILCD